MTDQIDQVDATQSDPVNTADTQTGAETTPPATGDGHGEDQPTSISTSDQSASDTTEKNELAQRREQGKLRQVQEENQKLRAQTDTLAGFVASDPKIYKNALMRMQGISEDQANQVIEDLKVQNPGLWKEDGKTGKTTSEGFNPQQINALINNHPAVQSARSYISEQEERFYADFEKDKDWIEKSTKPEIIRSEIGARANFLQRQNPSLSRLDAFNKAAQSIRLELDPKAVDEIREEAELQGMVTATNSRSSNLTSQPGRTTTSKTVQLSPYQERIWRTMNETGAKMTREEYLQQMQE